METFTLTPAELAVLTQQMVGAAPAELEDLDVDGVQLAQVRARLVERGMLVPAAPADAAGVAGRVALVLGTTLNPARRGMLRVTRRDSAAETMFLSISPECIALNYENGDGLHEFAELADLDEALAFMTRASGVHALRELPEVAELQSLAALLGDTQVLTLLTVAAEPAQARAPTRSISWLDARGAIWLADPGVAATVPSARPVSIGQLCDILASLLDAPAGGPL